MKTFVISEIGINHDGSIDRAKDMIYESMAAGASAVKLQTYTMDERVNDQNAQYAGLFKKCMLSYKEQVALKEYADSIGIELFSTPFGERSLEFLVNQMGVKKVKLASFDVTNLKFLKKVRDICDGTGISIIMSTGMATDEEVMDATWVLRDSSLSILHCVSAYPTPYDRVNLSVIRNLKKRFPNCPIGYSDHTSDIHAPAASILAGAEIVEKHFTLDHAGPGVDNPVSADKEMLHMMVNKIKMYEQMLGDDQSIRMLDIEQSASIFRRYS